MQAFFFVLALLLAAPVQAEGEASDAQQRLDEAVVSYTSGDLEGARNALSDLLNDPALVDPELRLRARIYLGEVLYVEGQRAAAWDAFRAAIREQPDYHLDPYEHPPDIVAFFETVKAATTTLKDRLPDPNPPATTPTTPFPILGVLPFGLYQVTHDQPVRGSLLAFGELATGVGSVALYVSLRNNNDAGTDRSAYKRLILQRDLQWACFAGFYGLWFTGVVDAQAHWRKNRTSEVGLLLDPATQTAGLTLHVDGW